MDSRNIVPLKYNFLLFILGAWLIYLVVHKWNVYCCYLYFKFYAKDETPMEIYPREPQGWRKNSEFALINIFSKFMEWSHILLQSFSRKQRPTKKRFIVVLQNSVQPLIQLQDTCCWIGSTVALTWISGFLNGFLNDDLLFDRLNGWAYLN